MSNKRIIQVEEKVPFQLLLPLSIQHMFAMFEMCIRDSICCILPVPLRPVRMRIQFIGF